LHRRRRAPRPGGHCRSKSPGPASCRATPLHGEGPNLVHGVLLSWRGSGRLRHPPRYAAYLIPSSPIFPHSSIRSADYAATQKDVARDFASACTSFVQRRSERTQRLGDSNIVSHWTGVPCRAGLRIWMLCQPMRKTSVGPFEQGLVMPSVAITAMS
jgi:hypothetical protein